MSESDTFWPCRLVASQNKTIWAVESVAQIALNAMQNQNKTLAYSCVEVTLTLTNPP